MEIRMKVDETLFKIQLNNRGVCVSDLWKSYVKENQVNLPKVHMV